MRIGTLDAIAPTVNFASRATAPAGSNFGIRVIPDCQLFYVVSGRAELRLAGQSHPIRDGECVYYGPERATRLSVLESTDYFSLHFHWHHPSPAPVHPAHGIREASPRSLDEGSPTSTTLDLPPFGEVAIPTLLSVSGLEPILARMVKEYELEQPGCAIALRALMMQAVAVLVRQLLGSRPPAGAASRIEPAIAAMQAEPARGWTVAQLAALCGYHPIHFAKLFKEEIGLPPKPYLIGERIKQAKRALLQGVKVEAISERLGYASIHHFSHQFKQVTGLTPTQFRLQGSSFE
ncbi:AraC family transcriptional regulator [Cohnella nanjingensis]|uniref:Helix-turn-helix transcriptional regulator n=1 Tax=Cohnella nanjingensis TaxID=1387779 RepID=A0A7X0RVM3_9BACL|nr:AraC family transcriptional regulator [Cohnella nanjingensis]MBB6674435.1 helix-turn-helix transcriptional regulator [Cohnella nanjingensis]